MIGGEESGGIGLPDHVKERDGLLMALLLTECMAQSGKDLGTDHREMLADIGRWSSLRRGLLSPTIRWPASARNRARTADEIAGKRVRGSSRWREAAFGRRRLGDDAPLRHRAARADLRRGGHHRRGKRESFWTLPKRWSRACRPSRTTRPKGRQSHCALAAARLLKHCL